MKELQLIDRVVVEIKDAYVDDCTNEYVASVLRGIADQIVNGRKGGRYSPDEGFEALWEHECPSYGGFRMGDKSLIAMHYYGSEPKPIVIDPETIAKVVEWRKKMYEKDGDDMKYTDGELNEDAEVIMDSIVEQWKEQSQ